MGLFGRAAWTLEFHRLGDASIQGWRPAWLKEPAARKNASPMQAPGNRVGPQSSHANDSLLNYRPA